MITAKDFCIKCSHKNLSGKVEPADLIEFAGLHVHAALIAAYIQIESNAIETYGSGTPDCWDRESILAAYPEDLIE